MLGSISGFIFETILSRFVGMNESGKVNDAHADQCFKGTMKMGLNLL